MLLIGTVKRQTPAVPKGPEGRLTAFMDPEQPAAPEAAVIDKNDGCPGRPGM